MFQLVTIVTLALTAASAVHGAAIPRATAPASYDASFLEVRDFAALAASTLLTACSVRI